MRPEDWERAEEWFHRLAPLDVAERSERLEEVSATDPDLAGEVRSLLSAHDSEGLLDRLTAKLAPEAPGAGLSVAPLTGASITHYEVGKLVGRGGMGDVYRARDTRLDREVALKFLPAWLGRDPAARDRFLVEARIVSSIDHPNVCTLFDIGETHDGRLFLVMPFYDGETLKQRLAKGSLSEEETLDVALQVARGLAAAHERGIVHRDVKPGNLLLADDGRVKILDFGVAKLADVSLTRPGETPGTASYMAPEQSAGGSVDARADLWALGAVMYEMLTGARPAGPIEPESDGSGATAEGLAVMPRGLAETVVRLLATRPDERYPDARALIEDLEVLAGGPGALSARPAPSLKRFLAELKRRHVFRVAAVYGVAGFAVIEAADMIFPRIPLPEWTVSLVVWLVLLGFPIALVLAWAFEMAPGGVRRTRSIRPAILDAIVAQPAMSRWPIGVAGLIGGALIVSGAWLVLGDGVGTGGNSTDIEAGGAVPIDGVGEAVAVLPFRSVGVDSTIWGNGIVDMLSFNFDGVPGLRKVDPMAVLTTWDRAVAEHGASPDVATALSVARRVGADYAVMGSAVRLGEGGAVRLATDVYDVEEAELRGSVAVEGAADSVVQLVDALAVELLRENLVPVDGETPLVNLARITTGSLPALKAYVAGEQHYRRGRYQAAIADFQRAVELDSTFARALHRLAGAYGWEEEFELGAEFHQRAARFADRLPTRDSMLISLANYFRNDPDEVREFTRRYPDDADGWYLLGETLFHDQGSTFVPQNAYIDVLERAVRLAPHYEEPYSHLLEAAFVQLDSARVRELLPAYDAVDPAGSPCRGYTLVFEERWGSASERAEAAATLDTLGYALVECAHTTAAVSPTAVERVVRASASQLRQPPIDAGTLQTASERAMWRLLGVLIRPGRADELRAVFGETEANPAIHGIAAAHEVMLHLAGYPDSAGVHEAAATVADELTQMPFGPRSMLGHFWLGALAVDESRWADVERAAAAIDSIANELRPEDENLAAAVAPYGTALLEFSRIKRGDRSRLPQYESAQSGIATASWVSEFPAYHMRYALARDMLERGQLPEAERYLLSLYPYAHPYWVPAQFYLGRVYEEQGRISEARERYRVFVEWWREADPALQPLRDLALEALRRLAPDA